MGDVTPAEAFREAILLCRAERWRDGLTLLQQVAREAEHQGNLPGAFYSYLGVAMARVEGRKREGMELCRHALATQPGEPDNHLNLASIYLILGRRRAAVEAMEEGLRRFPNHQRLLDFQQELGVRQGAVLPFLARSNPLNVLLGRLRYGLRARLDDLRGRSREDGDD